MARTAAKHSAMAARWSGSRVSMGSAGRNRRMRAAQNPRLLKRRTPGKRREESSDHESVVQISAAEQLAIHPEAVPEPASSSRPSTPNTTLARPVQTGNEVDRTSGRSSLDFRLSLAELYTCTLTQLVGFLMNYGFIAGTLTVQRCIKVGLET